MRASILLALAFGLAFSTSPAMSQETPVGAVRTHIEGIEIPPVPGVPFTATVFVTWNQPLVGGGVVSRKYYTMVARDSQGRVRRETRGFVHMDSDAEPPLLTFTVLDPVAKTRMTCTRASMACATSTFNPQLLLSANAGDNANPNRVSLGQQMIEGLPANGTRETASNAAGSPGSGRLAVSQTDVWYSPDLHMALSVIRNDPQLGQVTLNVTDLVQGEPDSKWFAIPSAYNAKGGATK